jgi:hypothetical protein
LTHALVSLHWQCWPTESLRQIAQTPGLLQATGSLQTKVIGYKEDVAT